MPTAVVHFPAAEQREVAQNHITHFPNAACDIIIIVSSARSLPRWLMRQVEIQTAGWEFFGRPSASLAHNNTDLMHYNSIVARAMRGHKTTHSSFCVCSCIRLSFSSAGAFLFISALGSRRFGTMYESSEGGWSRAARRFSSREGFNLAAWVMTAKNLHAAHLVKNQVSLEKNLNAPPLSCSSLIFFQQINKRVQIAQEKQVL
jgi:hypothetical protein